MTYKSGRCHADADCLSRLPSPTVDADDDDFDNYLAAISSNFPNLDVFRHEQQRDPSLKPMIDVARSSKRATPFVIHDALLYRKNYSSHGSTLLLVVPECLRLAVFQAMHDDITSGHLGFARTLHRIRQRFYWPRLWKTTKHYVASCDVCQRHKQPTTPSAGPLQPVKPPTSPFEKVGIDLLGPFPKSTTGRRWIIVCVDYLTRYTETMAVASATSSDVSWFLLHSIILRHGAPRVVISDRGRQFTADVVEELLRLCGCQYRHSTPYHPQTNGLTERTNRTIINMLSMYVAADHKNWDAVLPFVTYAFNTAKHEVTGYTPFFLLYARHPQSFLDTILPFSTNENASVAQTLCRAEEARRLARLRTLSAHARAKDRYDAKHPPVTFATGDLVWLWTPVRKKGLCQKFLSKYSGPFVITQCLSDITYAVAKVTAQNRRSRKTQIVHIARLKPYNNRSLLLAR